MPPILPTFQDQYLQSFFFCSCFPLSSTPLSELVRQLGARTEKRETHFKTDAGLAWIRVEVGRIRPKGPSAGDEGHIHVNCRLISESESSRTKSPPSNTREEVEEILSMFTRERSGTVCCNGRFRIPKDALPGRGVVSLMLDVAVKVGRAQMGLTGAEFDVRDRPPYRKIRWRLEEANGKPALRAEILAYGDVKTAKGRMDKMLDVLSRGVRELITESTSQTGERP